MFRHPLLVLSVSLVAALVLTAPVVGAGDHRRGSDGRGGSSLACCTLRSISTTFGCGADPQIAAGAPPVFSSVCAVLYGLSGSFCGDSVVCGD